jgi:hypothetical protein
MTHFKVCLAIILVFCTTAVFGAERNIYTWTDERGNLHVTDEPPPSSAKVKDVETYRDQTPEEVKSVERTLQQREARRQAEELQSDVAEAQRRAAEAAEAAVSATERAQALTREAQEYVRRFGNTPERRKQFKYKIQAKKDVALAAQDAALEARALADQAKLEARQLQTVAEEAANQRTARTEDELRLDE